MPPRPSPLQSGDESGDWQPAPRIVRAFAARVLVPRGGGCWLWGGDVDRDGYGRLTVGHTKVRAHRLAWMLHHGARIPTGMVVRHRCDTPACVRPDHLVLGTQRENVADREARHRSAAERVTHCPRGHAYAGDNLRIKVRRRRGATGKVRINRRCLACERLARHTGGLAA